MYAAVRGFSVYGDVLIADYTFIYIYIYTVLIFWGDAGVRVPLNILWI
jgi:hypothetical protein